MKALDKEMILGSAGILPAVFCILQKTPVRISKYCAAMLWITWFPAALQAQEKSADALFREGIAAFFEAKPKESVEAFDKLTAIAPDTAPQLWQRGLSLYYVEKFTEGRKQFELHQTVNPNDVENAAGPP